MSGQATIEDPTGLAPVRRARAHGLGDIPRRSAARSPERIAIVDGDAAFTFAQWAQVVDAVAAGLVRHGVTQGDRVAVLSHNCWQFAALSFATARIGALLVPINFMLGSEEIAFILEHSEPRLLVAEHALVGRAEQAFAASAHVPAVRVAIEGEEPGWPEFAALVGDGRGVPPEVDVADDDPIRLMYTSGTESRPKGALLSSRSLLWQYASVLIEGEGSADDVDLHALPLYHCAQLDCFLGPDLYIGARSVIARSPDPDLLLQMIEENRVTKFFAPPTVWIGMLNSPRFAETDLSSLRKGYYGASAMPVEVLARLAERLPQMRLWNFYGQTEMAPVATILKPEEQAAFAGAAGRAAINVETQVVDDGGVPVPPGTVGEIVHRSPHATLGYYRDPEKTAEAFQGGWFHSGDLGVFDEHGVLRVVDRKKDMIKSGGENVASREVEEVLYTMPGVAEVAVFGLPDPVWVEAVTAVVVPQDGQRVEADEVIAFARGRLAGFKIPKQVHVAEQMPKNPSGKILKRVLRDAYQAQQG
ncbi:fatty acyl-CoA synthetase [Nocardioides dubius]|uniref:Acyl-CoA synthetase n=1 Tax=Nocardioides dubius TaxID=317019 RepID=A0ABN1TVY9_9ACTN